jgi:hypothetical protein
MQKLYRLKIICRQKRIVFRLCFPPIIVVALGDYLTTSGWNKMPPAPELPSKVVEQTRAKYLEAYKLLTGKDL